MLNTYLIDWYFEGVRDSDDDLVEVERGGTAAVVAGTQEEALKTLAQRLKSEYGAGEEVTLEGYSTSVEGVLAHARPGIVIAQR